MYKAVLFDMDGLIIDTEKHYQKAWIQAAKELGFNMTVKEQLYLRSCTKKYAEPIMQKFFGPDFDYDKVRNRRKEIMDEDLKKFGIEKKPYVDEILDFLKEEGIKRALVTATHETKAREYLKEIELEEKFDKVICADMVENGKPDPDIYLFACEKIGEKPSDCLALEDSPNGVRSAYSAGVDVIMVPDLSEPDEELNKIILKSAGSLKDVISFLQNMEIQ
ncbi:MAG: HAD family hydrolase [Catonella sp.]